MFVEKFIKLCLIQIIYLSLVIIATAHLVGTTDTPQNVDGESRAGFSFKGIRGSRPKPPRLRPSTPSLTLPSGISTNFKGKPINGPKIAPRRMAMRRPTPVVASKLSGAKVYTQEQLESALDMAGVKCGTVPLFKRFNNKSINEPLTEQEKADQGDFRIINGINSRPGEWPWIVKLLECQSKGQGLCYMCTGTLLNNRWILSAGHCGYNKSHVSNFKATFGLYDMVAPDRGSFSARLDQIIVHPDYHDLNNDVALFRLASPINFSEMVQPACLIRATRNALQYTSTKRCYAVGYGLTAGMVAAVKLQKLRIKPKPPSECNSDRLGAVRLRRNTICIGVPDGQTGATCKGDSGGPHLCYNAKLDHWELFGTTSYGPAVCDREAGDKWLTVSVDVSNYRTWILSTILDNS